MHYLSHACPTIPAGVQMARFAGHSGVDEYHLIVHPTAYGHIDTQLEWIRRAYRDALSAIGLDPRTALLRRFFCSDLANQTDALTAQPFSRPDAAADPCAVSWVEMPSAPPAKVALWANHVNDPAGPLAKTWADATLVWQRADLAHYWTTGLVSPDGDVVYDQTRATFEQYDALLKARQLSWSTHVLRTWVFVRSIEANYADVVAARREFFCQRGLTPQTHYVASTGIEGAGADPAATVMLDAYAVQGIRPEQIEFLVAPEYLGPTHLYGVTFERGVAIAYRDRRHLIISGTASIDPLGRIVHPGDVARQLERTLENIAALLRAAGAALSDVGVFIVYVRDPGDQLFVSEWLHAHCGSVPIAVLVAPICRAGWLVEIEGLGVIPATQPDLPAY